MKNKKLLIIVAAVVVVIAVVLAVVLLGGNKTPNPTTTTTTGGNPQPTAQTYKLGMGVAFGEHGTGESNLTIAVVVLDEQGKIVACRLDSAQNKYAFDEDEEEIVFSRLTSKMELGADYGMGGKPYAPDNDGDGRVLEWDAQAKAFEAHVVGMTAAEVAAMTTQLVNDHHISTDADLLAAGCTIQIGEFRDAVVKACNDEQGTTFTTDKTFTVGLGVNSENDGSSAEDAENYTIKMNVEFAAAVVAEGKILASLNDAYQPVITVADGEVATANVGKVDENYQDVGFMTKRELKEYYMMAVYGASADGDGDGRVLEWYVQSAAFSAHVVGMTGTEVANMTTGANNIGYQMSTDADLVAAGCTIQITGIKTVVAEAVNYAR